MDKSEKLMIVFLFCFIMGAVLLLFFRRGIGWIGLGLLFIGAMGMGGVALNAWAKWFEGIFKRQRDPEPPLSSLQPSHFCRFCGSLVPPRSIYCEQCGQKLE